MSINTLLIQNGKDEVIADLKHFDYHVDPGKNPEKTKSLCRPKPIPTSI